MNLDDCTQYAGKHGYVLCDAAEYERLKRYKAALDAMERFDLTVYPEDDDEWEAHPTQSYRIADIGVGTTPIEAIEAAVEAEKD